MKPDYSHNDKLAPLTDRGRAELKEAFEKWFTKILLVDGSSCLERDVLRNTKPQLLEEWYRVRPHHTSDDSGACVLHTGEVPNEGDSSGPIVLHHQRSIAAAIFGKTLPVRVRRQDWAPRHFFIVEKEHKDHSGCYWGTEVRENGESENTIWGNEADKIGWELYEL